MKKLILSLLLACSAFTAQAMSYEQAREEARFLTDKMAYELNLNDQQYNDCYEINLDYFLSLSTQSDLLYGNYLAYRNADLRHILLDWQWTLFATADYFLNPVSWLRGTWYFPIYRHYAAGRFFYNRPHVFWSYRGGHGRFYFHSGFYSTRRPRHWGGGFRGQYRGPIGPRHHENHRGAGRPGGNRPGYHFENARPGGNPAGHHGNGRPGNITPGNGGHSGGNRPGNITPGAPGNGGHNGGNSNRNGGTVNNQGRAGYTIGTPSRGDNQPAGFVSPSTSNSNRSGHSSYQHESSTRTTVHSTAGQSSQGRAGSMGSSRGSFSGGSSRSQGSFGGGGSRSQGSFSGGSSRSQGSFSGGSSRGGGASHGGGSSRGGSSHGGGRGGR